MGAIASLFFSPPTSHEYPFLQHYLGHAIDSAATGHYFRYRLLDEKGNYIEDRGIKTAEFGELPLPNFRQVKAKIVDEAALIPETKADTFSETIVETITEAVPILISETEENDGQLFLTSPEILTPSLFLLPSLTDNPLVGLKQKSSPNQT